MRALLSCPITIVGEEGGEEEKGKTIEICPPKMTIQGVQIEAAWEAEKSSKKADGFAAMTPADIRLLNLPCEDEGVGTNWSLLFVRFLLF